MPVANYLRSLRLFVKFRCTGYFLAVVIGFELESAFRGDADVDLSLFVSTLAFFDTFKDDTACSVGATRLDCEAWVRPRSSIYFCIVIGYGVTWAFSSESSSDTDPSSAVVLFSSQLVVV